jgi:hypothetical protein
VGNWNLDEGSGTTVIDSSGSNNNGTISGATYTNDTPHKAAGQGAGKYALSFDGVNDCVNVNDSPSLRISGNITMSLWIKPNLGTRQVLIDKGYNGAFRLGYISEYPPYPIIWMHGNGTSYESGTAYPSTENNKWQYLVLVRDTAIKKYRAYRDGVLITTTSYAIDPADTGFNVTLGCRIGGSEFFNGLMDEVQIYNHALTASEIQKLYAQGLPIHQNLVIK